MYQQSFLPDDPALVVNVASVPQRSPFRYPGGKTWLVPRLRQWLRSQPKRLRQLIEPFAGGAVIGLTAVAERLVDHVELVELDDAVAAVWQTIIHDEGGAEWLGERICEFNLTPESVQEVIAANDLPTRERAFQTILRNRVNRGGILAPGAGQIKYGEAGKGLLSRWYPETLRKRILEISQYRSQLTFTHGDGMAALCSHRSDDDTVFFIDPPYTASKKRAGSRLYTYSSLNHEALFSMATALRGDFLLTYDNAAEVKALADLHGLDTRAVPMKNTHHAKMTELLIGRDLHWLG